MRKVLKFLHTLASCGLIGALCGNIVVLIFTPQATAQSYADMRQTIHALSAYMLLPSLWIALLTGLLAMMVHKPFLDLRWVWIKAFLGLTLFEGTLAIVQSKAKAALEEAERIAAGAGDPASLASIIANEWMSLYAILALSTAQIALGIWRPR
jgi:hypothetical protein